MKKDTHIKKRNLWIMFLIAAVVMCTAVTVGVRSAGNITEGQYKERISNVNILMEKISHHVESAISFRWETLHMIRNHIARELPKTAEEIIRCLKHHEEDIEVGGIQRIILIDDKGMCYTSDGDSFKWPSPSLLMDEEDRVLVSEYQFADAGGLQMYYLTRLEQPIQINGASFTHISLVEDMSAQDSFFDVSGYIGECITYIVRADGTQVYRQEKENELAGIYNVFSVMKRAQFHFGGSMEQFLKDMEEGVDDCINITIGETRYFVAYCHLNIRDWIAVLMVPEEFVGTGTQIFAREVTKNVFMMTLAAFSVLFIIILAMFEQNRKKQEQMNAHLARIAEAEREANEAKTRFLSAMSHDIRTPMNAIIGMTTIASKRLDDSDYVAECLLKIKRASHHLLTLINDILDISKVESGKMSLNLSDFSLAETMNSIINIVQPMVKEKGLRFHVRTHKINREWLHGDELRINQIFINLLTNAVKFTEPGGLIEMDLWEETTAEAPDMVHLTFVVKDTGIGMSKEFQSRMYDSFSRAADTRINKIQGTGLGLAICKQMVDLMGGTMRCESEEGAGTTFVVKLALAAAEQEAEVQRFPELELLLVDDDDIFLDTASEVLMSLGLVVYCAGSGEQALEMMKEKCRGGSGYPLVIVDKQLPGMDGIETTRQIRNLVGSEVPIILISAYDTTEFEEDARLAGANSVISKPFFRSNAYQKLYSFIYSKDRETAEKKEMNYDLAGRNILVAEDNDMNWEIMSAILEMYDIHACRAENGRECVEMMERAEEGQYDIILMDVRMPVMDGREATRLLRKSEKPWIRHIPIIAMTADAFSDDIQLCLEAGMNAHLPKPLETDKLFRKLAELCGGG